MRVFSICFHLGTRLGTETKSFFGTIPLTNALLLLFLRKEKDPNRTEILRDVERTSAHYSAWAAICYDFCYKNLYLPCLHKSLAIGMSNKWYELQPVQPIVFCYF